MSKKQVSKYISLILRHNPGVIGITMDEHGWADVNKLIAGVNKTHHLDMALLEKIVAEDEKQRYSFNKNKTLIRTIQGHSVPVDVELEEKTPPEYLYHGTGEKSVRSIDTSGLVHGSRLYVHLSEDIETVIKVGARHGKPVVYLVDSKQIHLNGFKFYIPVNGVRLTKEVPEHYLKRLT